MFTDTITKAQGQVTRSCSIEQSILRKQSQSYLPFQDIPPAPASFMPHGLIPKQCCSPKQSAGTDCVCLSMLPTHTKTDKFGSVNACYFPSHDSFGTAHASNNGSDTDLSNLTSRAGHGHQTSENSFGSDNQKLALGPFFNIAECHGQVYSQDGLQRYTVSLDARFDRGFFTIDNGTNWVCYRRNYFQMSAAFTCVAQNSPARLSSASTHYSYSSPTISSVPSFVSSKPDFKQIQLPCIVVDRYGVSHYIRSFQVLVTASIAGTNTLVELTQQTSKRLRGMQRALEPISCLPGGNLSQPANNDPSTVAVFERLQFASSTINNGRARSPQQYFCVQVALIGVSPNGSRIVLATAESAPLVVRGRSPSHYAMSKTNPAAAISKIVPTLPNTSPSNITNDHEQKREKEECSTKRAHTYPPISTAPDCLSMDDRFSKRARLTVQSLLSDSSTQDDSTISSNSPVISNLNQLDTEDISSMYEVASQTNSCENCLPPPMQDVYARTNDHSMMHTTVPHMPQLPPIIAYRSFYPHSTEPSSMPHSSTPSFLLPNSSYYAEAIDLHLESRHHGLESNKMAAAYKDHDTYEHFYDYPPRKNTHFHLSSPITSECTMGFDPNVLHYNHGAFSTFASSSTIDFV
ncbi:hypothetical protein QVD99_004315 [Batrachochytrium dendrobatidis]|nr:hypothetical protein O5D80_002068 [Batrachochytrium dendrobatidis]KAK5669943.1 hypothetical protein QVD99_004315 [Batrachochytrium dendrobatidis]